MGTDYAGLAVAPQQMLVQGQKERIFDEEYRSAAAAGPEPQPQQVDMEADGPVAHAMLQPAENSHHHHHHDSLSDIYLTALVAGCTASAVAAILALGVCFYR